MTKLYCEMHKCDVFGSYLNANVSFKWAEAIKKQRKNVTKIPNTLLLKDFLNTKSAEWTRLKWVKHFFFFYFKHLWAPEHMFDKTGLPDYCSFIRMKPSQWDRNLSVATYPRFSPDPATAQHCCARHALRGWFSGCREYSNSGRHEQMHSA